MVGRPGPKESTHAGVESPSVWFTVVRDGYDRVSSSGLILSDNDVILLVTGSSRTNEIGRTPAFWLDGARLSSPADEIDVGSDDRLISAG